MLSISIENYQLHNITKANVQFYNTFAILQITVAFLQLLLFLNEKCRYYSTYENEYRKG